ncbi:MAG: hypothetical protein O3A63_20875 [Proteobacteria bacterium]|nr:hypothetical protein [Pseudomonadota bacterium]
MAALVALAAWVLPLDAAPLAAPCPPPSSELLFHSCWGQARLAIRLLPEDLPLSAAPQAGRRLIVTGAYTGRDTRGEGLPKPVGLFIHQGQVLNPNLGRMDGVLVVDPADGVPRLHHRARLQLAENSYDLTMLEQRRQFIRAAASAGVSVMQSHLLIADGKVDVRPGDGAPAFVRRLLFIETSGFGIFQTESAMTLHDAAIRLAQAHAPKMALNLDMGSYDFCRFSQGGREIGCGILGGTAKLSNLLLMTSD